MTATSESCCIMRNGVGEEIPHLSNNKEKHTFSQQLMKPRKLKMAASSGPCCIVRNCVGEDTQPVKQ